MLQQRLPLEDDVFLGDSWCHSFGQLLGVQGFLTGIGIGMAFGAGILVLQSYFTTNLGIAAGLTPAGGSFRMRSGVLSPNMLLQLSGQKVVGYWLWEKRNQEQHGIESNKRHQAVLFSLHKSTFNQTYEMLQTIP